MAFIADILLLAGALGAGLYCHVLSKRLRKFTNLEKGVGGAVAVLSAQVDGLGKTLEQSQNTARGSVEKLGEVSDRAEAVARRLELLVASLHDLPETQTEKRKSQAAPSPFFVRSTETVEGRQ
jgi:hypothetical protein